MSDVTPWPFETVEEVRMCCLVMAAGAEDHSQVLLEDASQFFLDVYSSAALASLNTRWRVVFAVVRRSIEAQSSPGMGMETFQATSGPFSSSYTPTNP